MQGIVVALHGAMGWMWRHPLGTMKVGISLKEIPRDTEWWEMQEASYPQGQPSDAFHNTSLHHTLWDVVGCSQVMSRDASTDPSTNWSFPWSCRGKSYGASPSICMGGISTGFTWAKQLVQRHPWTGSASEVITSHGL